MFKITIINYINKTYPNRHTRMTVHISDKQTAQTHTLQYNNKNLIA